MIIKDELQGIVSRAFQALVRELNIDVAEAPYAKIEYPKEEKFGDYATPIALECARLFRKSPMEIGNLLINHMDKTGVIKQVELARPGFINMFLSQEFLCENLWRILEERDTYGENKNPAPRRINIEFVSANPTGPLVIVSARAAALGDTLSNLLRADGNTVEKEFYVNDFGNQVYLLGKSVLSRYRELQGRPTEFPEDGYHGDYVRDIAAHVKGRHEAEVEALGEEEAIQFMAGKAIEYNIEGQKRDLERFNVVFDNWFHEKGLHEAGDVERALEYLNDQKVIYESEGKKFFSSTDYGDDKDRVVVRDDGRPTYLLADITYHKNKVDRRYDLILDIWGPDHHGYIARLSGAMQCMGYGSDRFRVLIAQQVNLVMEGEIVKMSKRLGNFSTMAELIDEIGVDVARYFFVMRSMDSHLDFDLALAKKQSSENPVFYLQYAHARICSIFREAESRGITYKPSEADKDHLQNPEAVNLLKLLAKFPEEIHDAAVSFEPHRIANFLLRLAQGYHRFYTEHRVLSEEKGRTAAYLSLCDAVRIVLRNGLRLLGVSSPERM